MIWKMTIYKSTTVEITIGYLTQVITYTSIQSTTVEITIGYLTRLMRYTII